MGTKSPLGAVLMTMPEHHADIIAVADGSCAPFQQIAAAERRELPTPYAAVGTHAQRLSSLRRSGLWEAGYYPLDGALLAHVAATDERQIVLHVDAGVGNCRTYGAAGRPTVHVRYYDAPGAGHFVGARQPDEDVPLVQGVRAHLHRASLSARFGLTRAGALAAIGQYLTMAATPDARLFRHGLVHAMECREVELAMSGQAQHGAEAYVRELEWRLRAGVTLQDCPLAEIESAAARAAALRVYGTEQVAALELAVDTGSALTQKTALLAVGVLLAGGAAGAATIPVLATALGVASATTLGYLGWGVSGPSVTAWATRRVRQVATDRPGMYPLEGAADPGAEPARARHHAQPDNTRWWRAEREPPWAGWDAEPAAGAGDEFWLGMDATARAADATMGPTLEGTAAAVVAVADATWELAQSMAECLRGDEAGDAAPHGGPVVVGTVEASSDQGSASPSGHDGALAAQALRRPASAPATRATASVHWPQASPQSRHAPPTAGQAPPLDGPWSGPGGFMV
jgi:hypothetical protein